MNRPHDLGGRSGFGRINVELESEEKIFHSEWERRIFGLMLAVGGLGYWNLDQSRYARERQSQQSYLRNTYYENWLIGLETLLVESGLLGLSELESGICERKFVDKASKVLRASDVEPLLRKGQPATMAPQKLARFSVGDAVRVLPSRTIGHTRAPNYIQGKEGTIRASYGSFIYPDKHAEGLKGSEYLYNVEFSNDTLRRAGLGLKDFVMVDLFDAYLELA